MTEREKIPLQPVELGKTKPANSTTEVVKDSLLLEKFSPEDAITQIGSKAPEQIVKEVKEKLGLHESVEALINEKDDTVKKLKEALKYFSTETEEKPESSIADRANFSGDWSELTKQRLEHPVGFIKYMLLKLGHIEKLKPGSPSVLDKPTDFRQYVFEQIKNYDEVLDHVFGATEITTAEEQHKKPTNLGVGNYGKRPTVFSDATHKDGTLLDARQKHITESHEAGHGIRKFIGEEGQELRSLLDQEKIPTKDRTYLSNPDEIAERMNQLKNYFGLGPTENFTTEHLQYAREHYITDTGLDNSMTEFFNGVTPDREELFIRLINEMPI